MLRTFIQKYLDSVLPLVVRFLARYRISADLASLLGLGMAALAGYFFANGWFWAGALFVLVHEALDLVDGALAREAGPYSTKGILVDSLLDRVSDLVLWIALGMYFATNYDMEGVLVAWLILGASFLTAFLQKTSEQPLPRPFAGRFEQNVFLAAGALFQPFAERIFLLILWILALGLAASVGQLVYWRWNQLHSSTP